MKNIQPVLIENIWSEYLVETYPSNYFDFFIDIGARGTKHPWHVHNIAKNNPQTKIIALEPDLPYYNEIVKKKDELGLENLTIIPCGLGAGESIQIPDGKTETISLPDILEKYDLDISKTWAFKIDCEGCERHVMNEECVDILKQCDHFGVEFHGTNCGANYFTDKYELFDNMSEAESWLTDNFDSSHEMFVTDMVSGLASYVVVNREILNSENRPEFWDSIT
jgi:hypothetical protein